jgi:hypothetical protein
LAEVLARSINVRSETDAKNPAGNGVLTESDGWRDAVKQHCEENKEKYQ